MAAEHRPGSARPATAASGRSPGSPGSSRTAASPATSGITRDVLERYLAGLGRAMAGKKEHRDYIGQVATFLRDVRRHQWDTGSPRPR